MLVFQRLKSHLHLLMVSIRNQFTSQACLSLPQRAVQHGVRIGALLVGELLLPLLWIRTSKSNSHQPALISATSKTSSTSTVNQQTSSRTSEDIQWPPPITSTAFTTQLSVDEKQNQNTGAHPGNSFADLDPFANWPPRQSNSASSNTGFATKSTNNNGTSGPNMSSLGFIDNSNPIGPGKPQQRTYSSNTSIGNSKSLPGIVNSNSLLGMGYSNTSSNGNRTGDLGSIFSSANSGQPTPRIAPPPTSTMGRERGRDLGHAGLAQASRSERPPILDLL